MGLCRRASDSQSTRNVEAFSFTTFDECISFVRFPPRQRPLPPCDTFSFFRRRAVSIPLPIAARFAWPHKSFVSPCAWMPRRQHGLVFEPHLSPLHASTRLPPSSASHFQHQRPPCGARKSNATKKKKKKNDGKHGAAVYAHGPRAHKSTLKNFQLGCPSLARVRRRRVQVILKQ